MVYRIWDHTRVREVRVYTNSQCNRDCSFCSYRALERGGETIWNKPYAYEVLSNFISEFHIKSIMASGMEPLLDRNWFELFNFLRKKKQLEYYGLATNGDIADESTLSTLRQAQYTFPGFHIHPAVTKPGDSGFSPLLRKLFRSEDSVYLSKTVIPYFVVNRLNYKDMLQFLKDIPNFISSVYWRFEYPINGFDKAIHFSPETQAFICATNFSGIKQNIIVPVEYGRVPPPAPSNIHYVGIHSRCMAYTNSFTISYNGDITGCAKHSYLEDWSCKVIGNMMTDSFSSIKNKLANLPEQEACFAVWQHTE